MTGTARLHLSSATFERRAAGLCALGIVTPTELLVVDAVADRFGEQHPDVLLGLAFAVRAPSVGDVGVHLPTIRDRVDDEGSIVRARWAEGLDAGTDREPASARADWPEDPTAWEATVLRSPMVGGPEQGARPFVCQQLADGRALVMTRRMWREQERLADAARALTASAPALPIGGEALTAGLVRLFGSVDTQGARAVATAAKQRLTVITGGPGTGKTYSINRLLALFVESISEPARPLRIELAAPTGKAAVRMAEAMAEDGPALGVDERVRAALATLRPRTLHKLLGVRPDGSSRHGRDRPIPAELVVVDEASMVDLALMRLLFEAIPPGARLVLLGDRDQLASVEAGTVLADLVGPVLDGAPRPNRALGACVVPFRSSYRFEQAPSIAAVADALGQEGDGAVARVGRWMRGQDLPPNETLPERITHLGAPCDGRPDEAQLDRLAAPLLADEGFIGQLVAAIRAHGPNGPGLRAPTLHLQLLDALERYRILTVHRHGPLGLSGIEHAVGARCQQALRQAIRDHCGHRPDAPVKLPARAELWLGRPVLVTRNRYDVGLMNGDIGLVLPTAAGLAAVFPVRHDGAHTTREISLARLPEHTGAFAMTVHKSQGSQFRRVALVLAGRDSPIQTRELVYTGITRASARLDWLGDPGELERALHKRVGRASGLGDLLWAG